MDKVGCFDMVGKSEAGLVAPEKMHLKPERVQEALRKLPAWRLGKTGVAIESERSFATCQRASSFAAYACRMASKMGQPVQVDLADKMVVVSLAGHPVRGCTGGLNGTVFKLADLIGS